MEPATESNIKSNDFTKTVEVSQTPEQVFNTLKNVREWWFGLYGEVIEGKSDKVGDVFTFHAGEGAHYSKQELVELIPNKRIVWLVIDSKLSFLKNTGEWNGSKIVFDISENHGNTKIVFTHYGLTPQIECYESCAPAWTKYLEKKWIAAVNK